MAKKNSIDVSVIVAAYNAEGTITAAIESALSQDGVSLEVIVVDDCSGDATVNAVKAIKDKCVRLVQHKKNGGPGMARNTALALAKGDWIAVLDGDDEFAPGRLRLLKVMGEERGSDVVCDDLMVRVDGQPTQEMFGFRMAREMDLAEFIRGNARRSGYTYGYIKPFIRTDFVRNHELQYPEDIRIGEDYIFMAQALAHGAKCSIQPDAGYLYSVHPGSISYRLSVDAVQAMVDADEAFLGGVDSDEEVKKAQQKRAQVLKEFLAYEVLVQGVKDKDFIGVLKSFKVCPWAAWRLWEPVWKRASCVLERKKSNRELVLLFFDGYDLKARSGTLGKVYSLAHYYARQVKRSIFRQQTKTGFYTAFESLAASLRSEGYDVRVNDFEAAWDEPDTVIGAAGYPGVLDVVRRLPNPVVLGPGDFGDPDEMKEILKRDKYKALIQPSDWFAELYKVGRHKGKVKSCFFGINTDKWADTKDLPKNYDFLVYDKIYWDRAQNEKDVLQRVLDDLEQQGLTYRVLKYGDHVQAEFAHALQECRAMIYLSAHETQGFSVQEAMACNVPVLAWDEGVFMDPALAKFMKEGIEVSSVPYFDKRCGLTFQVENFERRLAEFMKELNTYKPREFVLETLSYEQAAKRYMQIYRGRAPAKPKVKALKEAA